VRLSSIGFKPGLPLDQIADLVDEQGAQGADLIALPEACRGQNDQTPEPLDGPRRLNSAVLLDRRGRIAAIYDKIYPFTPELAQRPPIHPGQAVQVFPTGFGRLGLAICFDVNWAPLWERLSDLGAELVIWPSAYSAGRSLQARAIDFNYYIVSSTWVPDCLAFDIDGEQILHHRANRAHLNVTRLTLDLDRCLFHQDFNLPTNSPNSSTNTPTTSNAKNGSPTKAGSSSKPPAPASAPAT
jgi:predicted amidohydrolase